jgi:hypothetical protein
MKPTFLFIVSVLFSLWFLRSTPTFASSDPLKDLVGYSQSELNALYGESSPGEIPTGSSEGRAMFFPGTVLNNATAQLASYVWQGKVFDLDGKFLVNRILGFKAIRAKVFYGTSWYDGKESIIIDYKDTSLLAFLIRDEIREIEPGLYLGRAYVRTLLGPVLGVNFALEFKK